MAVSEAVKALLIDQRPHHCWDLWTFELTCGTTLRWTSADIDLEVGGESYRSEIAITRDKCKLTTGVENSTQGVTISPGALETEPSIAGIPMRQAIRAGLFDGAKVRLVWAYFEIGRPLQFVGTITRFTGTVGEIDCFKSKAVLTINSPLKRLDMQIPWKTYGAGCRYILGDADCGVNVSSYGVAGTVVPGSTNGVVVADLASVDKTWDGGTILLTSGEGASFRRTVRTNSGGALYLKTPLPWAPQAGDAVTVYPGCDKSAPVLGNASVSTTVPSTRTVPVATPDTFAGDNGVMLIGLTHTSTVWEEGYSIGGDWYPGFWRTVTTKDPDIAMVKVTGTPAAGQYALDGNVYTFSAADISRQVKISARTATGGSKGCWRFRNVARVGGMPYIPSPETAY